MALYTARMRVTYSSVVSCEAETEEEADGKFRAGEFNVDFNDDRIDWGDPTELRREDP